MVWFVDGDTQEKILDQYGLYSSGGSHNDNGMTYYVRSKGKDNFVVELLEEELHTAGELYKVYLRENKLKRILK